MILNSNCCLYFLVLWLSALLTNWLVMANLNLTTINNGKIVPEKSGRWPFMVALMINKNDTRMYSSFCGGTIMHEKAILTAAHCLKKVKPQDIILFMGNENTLHFGDKQAEFNIATKFIVHPDYKPNSDLHDIAVIVVKWPIPLGKKLGRMSIIDKICLPANTELNVYNTGYCYVLGWGRDQSDQKNYYLREVTMPVLDDESCRMAKWFGHPYNKDSMLCAGYSYGGNAHCRGDSGGPFLCSLSNQPEMFAQIGIISGGDGCGRQMKPGYSTKVSYYLDWLSKTSKQAHDEL